MSIVEDGHKPARRSRWQEAVHESAHSVVAVLNNVEVGEITLNPPKCWTRVPANWIQAGEGRRWVPDPAVDRHQGVAARARIAMAGILIDELFEHFDPESSDRLYASELILSLGLLDEEHHDRSAMYWNRLALRTKLQIDANWPAIQVIASELMTTGTVSGQRAKQLVNAAVPMVTVAPRPRPDWVRIFREISAPYTGEA